MQNQYGNYIGDDIEVVILKKYSLIYIFDKNKNTIESYLLSTDNFLCKAACITEANVRIDKEQSEKISFFRNIEGNAFTNNDKTKVLNNITLINIIQKNDQYVFTMFDGRTFSTVKQETYENSEVIPNSLDATEDNVAICLRKWHLGLHEHRINNTFVGLEFNTPKHMYIFHIADNFIYCRAARYATCNKGFVFTQNFRQNFHEYVGQSFALKNNKVALKNVNIAEDIFNPSQCVFSKYDIYWSVSKVENAAIYLNGCGGKIYIWKKPLT